MDDKDASIIKVLGRKAGLSSRGLSKMLGMPISTVHRRIKKLEREGIIAGYRASIDRSLVPVSPLSAVPFRL